MILSGFAFVLYFIKLSVGNGFLNFYGDNNL